MYSGQRLFPYSIRLFMTFLLCPSLVIAQTGSCVVVDPGPRPAGSFVLYPVLDGHGNTIPNFAQQSQDGTNNSSGNILPNVAIGSDPFNFWEAGLAKFGDVVSVKGTPATEPLPGMGPRFNGNSCFMCHSQPAIGGTSPGCVGTAPNQICTPQFKSGGNPQIALAHLRGATNTVPQIVSARPNGPVVEARFPRAIDVNNNPTNVLDGSVKALYTIKGRNDAPVPCNINQPPLDTELANNNLIMRIPTPTFGVGFVESTPDATLTGNLNAVAAANAAAGLTVTGHFNTSGNDQSITRFGWKAQNPSLLVFAGEASNVELGVTNELFPFERDPGDCEPNPTPEDFTTATSQTAPGASVVAQVSNAEAESFFMFLNTAPAMCDFSSGVNTNGSPQCLPLGTSAINGMSLFSTAHCDACHTPTLQTGPSPLTDLNNAPYHPFSDFAVHHMGANLTDGVTQGQAGPDEFRTAPLWGAGQRLFFLHDGRTSDILQAIQQHKTATAQCTTVQSVAETFILNGTTVTIPSQTTKICGSEANQAVDAFNALSCSNQLDLLHFLRSL